MPLVSTARADEPDCVPYNSATPSPSVTAVPTCYPAKNCCSSSDPSCTPAPWPTIHGNAPPMTPIPGAQPTDGTILEWRVYPPGFTFSSTTPSPTPTPTPGPGIVMIHGGSWLGGDTFQPNIERVCEILAQEGFWVFAGSYRLAPCGRITGQPAHGDDAASGRPPEQTDDVMALMMAARNSPQCSGHKIGILGSSVGGFHAAYVALYRNEIDVSGRPHWNPPGVDYRPDCVVTFSSPFDLSDQSVNDPDGDPPYIKDLQNYVGNCSLTDARSASPISLIDSGTKDSFKPMYMIQAGQDTVNPARQIDDVTIALNYVQVSPCKYVVSYIPDSADHALALWPHEDPNNPGHTIGDSAVGFFHRYLDDP
jgi:acetyl esterase/lipase